MRTNNEEPTPSTTGQSPSPAAAGLDAAPVAHRQPTRAPGPGAGAIASPTEERNRSTRDIDTGTSADVVGLILAEDAGVAGAVAQQGAAIAALVDMAVAALSRGGTVTYVGAGTSGRLAVLDAAELLPTYRVGPDQVRAVIAGGQRAMLEPVEGAEDDPDEGSAAVGGVTSGDLVIGLAASGRTPYVAGALRRARAHGAGTGLIACNPRAPLAADADVSVLVDTGPEAITGSTRMKAGTAQKMVLNAFSTAVMVRLGKTYSNLMVDVMATNEKLRRRIVRMLAQASGRHEDDCREALRGAGTPRAALVALLGEVSPQRASEILRDFPPDPDRNGDPSGVRSAVERTRHRND